MEDALELIDQSINLTQATFESWNNLWTQLFDSTNAGLWNGLVSLGLTLAAISILFVTVTLGKEIIEKQSWSDLVQMFVWPLVIIIFLGNNGMFLKDTVLLVRNFGHNQVTEVLTLQLGQLTFKEAISRVGISSAARQALDSLYSECQGLTGNELSQCWAQKQQQAEEILARAEELAGGPLDRLRDMVTGYIELVANPVGAVTSAVLQAPDLIQNVGVPLMRIIMLAMQWAFVNILEASLLLTALFAPVAMGLSLLPLQGRPIWAWLIGFISLFGVQLGYNIVVGLAAVVIVNSGGELSTDLAFLTFLSIFAPGLASLVAGGGGIALYNGINNNVKSVIDFASNAIGALTRTAVGFFL